MSLLTIFGDLQLLPRAMIGFVTAMRPMSTVEVTAPLVEMTNLAVSMKIVSV
jgi:hypothetical protein